MQTIVNIAAGIALFVVAVDCCVFAVWTIAFLVEMLGWFCSKLKEKLMR